MMNFSRSAMLRRTIEIALLFLVIWGVRTWQQRDAASGIAPPLDGTTLDGTPYTLQEHGDRPVLVHFWATWCSICALEQGNIDALSQDQAVITVAMQSGDSADVKRHLEHEQLRFPVINDPDGALATAWGVHAVPASFIVDAKGQIRFVEIGYTTQPGLRWRLWLAQQWSS